MEKGNISVQTENIFPIIKKFLYSEQEIFLRELVSNAVDATNKLKVLSNKGEFKGELGDLTIDIILSKEDKTITIRDRGIGMSAEEVKKYLNQVAFSSASEFLEKYKEDSGIIGHFGLGFYSAFMVAEKVEVVTRSYKEKESAVIWSCTGDPSYTLEETEKDDRGTDIILHIGEDGEEYLEKDTLEKLLYKYCGFLPIPIRFGKKEEQETVGEGEDAKTITKEVDHIINNPNPLWKKNPNDIEDKDYTDFYSELYPFGQPPLFWIHLNIDYPFNLNGILYFPRLENAMVEPEKNKIKLYSNQVYVTDDVSNILPPFLMHLHGVIDSPDIPLNVSRSYLQGDQNVRKITGYITKKVADKLKELFNADRKEFESKWDQFGIFVKYGMITEEKFYDKALSFALLKNTEGKYHTLEEHKTETKETQTDKNDMLTLLYASNVKGQNSFIKSATDRGYQVLVMDQVIDNHFVQHLEHKNSDFRFKRVDADTIDNLIDKDEKIDSVLDEKEEARLKEMFEEEIKSNSGLNLEMKALTPNDKPVVIVRPEFLRRMQEMQAMQGVNTGMGDMSNVVVNTNHPIFSQKLLKMRSAEKKKQLVQTLFDLARLNQNMLTGEELDNFVNRNLELLQ
nr:molecular chaperone HtpG [Saprospiraceae bacterium]